MFMWVVGGEMNNCVRGCRFSVYLNAHVIDLLIL